MTFTLKSIKMALIFLGGCQSTAIDFSVSFLTENAGPVYFWHEPHFCNLKQAKKCITLNMFKNYQSKEVRQFLESQYIADNIES